MHFKEEKALNRLSTYKYRKNEVGLEKWVGMGEVYGWLVLIGICLLFWSTRS